MIQDIAVQQSYLTPEIHTRFYEERKTGTPNYDFPL